MELKSAASIGGNLAWHSGNLRFDTQGNTIRYAGFKLFSEFDLPTPGQLADGGAYTKTESNTLFAPIAVGGYVKKTGDTMTGNLSLSGADFSISSTYPKITFTESDTSSIWDLGVSASDLIIKNGATTRLVGKADGSYFNVNFTKLQVNSKEAIDASGTFLNLNATQAFTGGIKLYGNTDTAIGTLSELGQRVYSPNNKPTADALGVLSASAPKSDWNTHISGLNANNIVELGGALMMGMTFPHYSNPAYNMQLASRDGHIFFRNKENDVFGSWNEFYHTNKKPTWNDVGGDNYWSIGTYITAQGGKWVQASNNATGFIPYSTGNSFLGTNALVFKEAWVNTYRGGSVNITGISQSKGVLSTSDVILQATPDKPSDTPDIVFNNSNGIEVGRFWKGSGADEMNVRFGPSAPTYTVYHTGNKPSPYDIGAPSAYYNVLDGTDLFEYLKTAKPGFHRMGSSIVNKPTGATSWMDMIVVEHATSYRTAIIMEGGTRTWQITITPTGVVGGGWKKIYSETQKPTANDVGTYGVADSEFVANSLGELDLSDGDFSGLTLPQAIDLIHTKLIDASRGGSAACQRLYADIPRSTNPNLGALLPTDFSVMDYSVRGSTVIIDVRHRNTAEQRWFTTRQANFSGGSTWYKYYTEANKPTWADVGGNNYWTIGTYLTAQGGKWIQASNNATGIIPYSTGNSFLGTSAFVFKESWVNTYRGGSVDVTGDVSIGQVLNFKQDYNGAHWQAVSESAGNLSFGLYDSANTFIKNALVLSAVGNVNARYQLYENGQRVYSPNNKPTAGDVGALASSGKAVDSSKLNGYTDSATATANSIARRTAAGGLAVVGLTASGDILASGNVNALNQLYENGQRVYSPNNKPTAGDVGLGNVPNYASTNSFNGTSTSLLATQKAVYDAAAAPLLESDRKRKITSGTAAPSGGVDGDIYLQYK